MENAVVYARYSSHNQTEQSIEGQLATAHKYADEKGYTIVKEYCDRAKTGTNDNREESQQTLHDCALKRFTVIIVWKVDRFGRNREEITFNKHRAKNTECELSISLKISLPLRLLFDRLDSENNLTFSVHIVQ